MIVPNRQGSQAPYHRPPAVLDDAKHVPAAHNDGMTAAKSFALAIEEARHAPLESLVAPYATARRPLPNPDRRRLASATGRLPSLQRGFRFDLTSIGGR
jgi:hypothetical protein